MSPIRHFARQIAERFEPERIVLFVSFACGTPHNESQHWFLREIVGKSKVLHEVRDGGEIIDLE